MHNRPKIRPKPPLHFWTRRPSDDDVTRWGGRSVTVPGADVSIFWIRFSGDASARCVLVHRSSARVKNDVPFPLFFLQCRSWYLCRTPLFFFIIFLSSFKFSSLIYIFSLWQFSLKNMQIMGKFTVNNLFFLLSLIICSSSHSSSALPLIHLISFYLHTRHGTDVQVTAN